MKSGIRDPTATSQASGSIPHNSLAHPGIRGGFVYSLERWANSCAVTHKTDVYLPEDGRNGRKTVENNVNPALFHSLPPPLSSYHWYHQRDFHSVTGRMFRAGQVRRRSALPAPGATCGDCRLVSPAGGAHCGAASGRLRAPASSAVHQCTAAAPDRHTGELKP